MRTEPSLSEIEKIASAETSLVLSHDAGQKAADYLSAAYGIEPAYQPQLLLSGAQSLFQPGIVPQVTV